MEKTYTVKGSCTVTWCHEDFLEESDGYDKQKAERRLMEFNPRDDHVIQIARDMYNIHDMDCEVIRGIPVPSSSKGKKMYDILSALVDDYVGEIEHQGDCEIHLMDGRDALVKDFLLYWSTVETNS